MASKVWFVTGTSTFFGSSGLPMMRADYAKRIETWEKWSPVSTAAQGDLAHKTPR